MARIVGWTSEGTRKCGKPARVIITDDEGLESYETCDECTPSGIPDGVGAVFARVLAKRFG